MRDITEADRERLNSLTRGLVQIPWWGTFQELMTGDSSYARSVRVWARSGDEDSDPTRPFDPEELEEFRAAIQEYGV